MTALRIDHHPNGPRLFIAGRRCHHFHFGLALITWGIRWVWLDRADLPRRKRAT